MYAKRSFQNPVLKRQPFIFIFCQILFLPSVASYSQLKCTFQRTKVRCELLNAFQSVLLVKVDKKKNKIGSVCA